MKPRRNTDSIVAVITSIICKHRRSSSCLIQRIISLILCIGHAGKQVRFPYATAIISIFAGLVCVCVCMFVHCVCVGGGGGGGGGGYVNT